jgi:hypothetical protein
MEVSGHTTYDSTDTDHSFASYLCCRPCHTRRVLSEHEQDVQAHSRQQQRAPHNGPTIEEVHEDEPHVSHDPVVEEPDGASRERILSIYSG